MKECGCGAPIAVADVLCGREMVQSRKWVIGEAKKEGGFNDIDIRSRRGVYETGEDGKGLTDMLV